MQQILNALEIIRIDIEFIKDNIADEDGILTLEEKMNESKELNKIWEEIDNGKGITSSKEEFLKEMSIWQNDN